MEESSDVACRGGLEGVESVKVVCCNCADGESGGERRSASVAQCDAAGAASQRPRESARLAGANRLPCLCPPVASVTVCVRFRGLVGDSFMCPRCDVRITFTIFPMVGVLVAGASGSSEQNKTTGAASGGL